MIEFRRVPDVIREREPVVRGRKPSTAISKALLDDQTLFIPSPHKSLGSFYVLAKHHNKQARTHKTIINGEEGTLIWFEEIGVE